MKYRHYKEVFEQIRGRLLQSRENLFEQGLMIEEHV